VPQRRTLPLPGSDGAVLLTLDDITRGQVMTGISALDGPVIVGTRSLREGDVVRFTTGGTEYSLKLVKLTNLLIGDDRATFRISPASAEPGTATLEEKRIETLIESLRQLDGATFIRNDTESTVDEAIAHITRKWHWQKDQIHTAEDFIEVAASKSSASGKLYLIRLPDGTETTSAEWLHKELEKAAEPSEEP